MNRPKAYCLKCRHYMNTYDPYAPRGCRLFNMRTKKFPSEIVKAETGSECEGYEERVKKKADGLDLNSDDLW